MAKRRLTSDSNFEIADVAVAVGNKDYIIIPNSDGSINTKATIQSQPISVNSTAVDEPRRITIEDINGYIATMDRSTYAQNTIDYPHHEVHGGSHYYLKGWVLLNEDAVLRIKLVTPDTAKWAHFLWDIGSSGITETTLDEGATGGMTGGTPKIPINNNRNSDNTSLLVITSGVTAASSYDLRIDDDAWGAGILIFATGGGSSREDEIMMKQNTTYLRTIISRSDSNIIQFKATWYEHTDKS